MVEQAKFLTTIKDPEEVLGLIQGMVPDSKNEWYVALALEKLHIDYSYQVPLYGGTSARGGQMIDFVVYCPVAIPVFIQGEHWHSAATETEDILKQQAAYAHYGRAPILLMGEETDSKDKAFQAVMVKVKL